MAKSLPLVAVSEITGGTPKDPHVTAPGTVITAAEQKKLGLDDKQLQRLRDNGAVVEQEAYVPVSTLPAGQTAPGTTGTEFEGMSIDAMRAFLDDAGVPYPKDANGPDLMKIALDFVHPSDVDVEASKIESSMKVEQIKAELDKLQVPYETDANKAALSKALAQARGAQG